MNDVAPMPRAAERNVSTLVTSEVCPACLHRHAVAVELHEIDAGQREATARMLACIETRETR
jgi:hypothetical protein